MGGQALRSQLLLRTTP